MALRAVAIVGRPNVGKSTLFNRIVGERRAVVHETSGVTRDRIVAQAEWTGHGFLVMDTGGIIPFGEKVSDFDEIVSEVSRRAIEEADVVILLVDGQVGPMAWDEAIARDLRQSGRPVIVAVNKTEKPSAALTAGEFFTLGLGEPMAISALHGRGVADLLDRVVADFPAVVPEPPCDARIAIVGRPNVGKSTLLNELVGHEAALVSDIPGTTRDSIHTDLRWHGRTLRLIDTAGLRRKSKVQEAVEAFSTMRTIRAIEECDVAVLMIDAAAGVVTQDSKIAGLIHDRGRGVVVAFNKWDLLEKDKDTHLRAWDAFLREIPFLTYAPWFTFSAVTKQRIGRILEMVWKVHQERHKRIGTSQLNDALAEITGRQPPRHHAGGLGRIYYATQAEAAPPVFVLSVNEPKFFARNYLRYINNQIRQRYGFEGSRIFVKLKKH
ncbi:MAG: ribosome biogenesis GTPase Der [Candidatus Krumholzibacteriia bacterium]